MAFRILKATAVRRGGQTARYTNFETNNVTIDTDSRSKVMVMQFSIASKGGGVTEIHISIRPDDFLTIIQSMTEADRHGTMAAMARELVNQIDAQPAQDEALLSKGRHSLRRQAERELRSAPASGKTAARFALETVNGLIENLENDGGGTKGQISPGAAP